MLHNVAASVAPIEANPKRIATLPDGCHIRQHAGTATPLKMLLVEPIEATRRAPLGNSRSDDSVLLRVSTCSFVPPDQNQVTYS
jgi:hypothetical protein